MNVEFVARDYDLNDRIREFANKKLKKVVKFLQNPEARFTLQTRKHRQIADLHVSHRFGVIQANEETDDMFDSVNLVVDKAEKQARRSIKKFQDKRRRGERGESGHAGWPVSVLEGGSVDRGEEPRIVKSSRFAIKPMTLDEAAIQLRESKNEFVVFKDSESDQVSVLYKRRDENYGLISPEG